MDKKELFELLDGYRRERVGEMAREMGITPEAACLMLMENELEKNPNLIGPNSPELEQIGSNIFSLNRFRH